MNNVFWKFIGVLILVTLILPFGAAGQVHSVSAQDLPAVTAQDEPTCWALDVVMLVDQSYSMFSKHIVGPDGRTYYDGDPKYDEYRAAGYEVKNPNDPNGYRYKAVQEVMSRLLLNGSNECRQAVHRLSLITFGDRAKTSIPLMNLQLGSGQSITDFLKSYQSKINGADGATDRTQNGTDFLVALDEAKKQLAAPAPGEEPVGYGPRRKIVILLTDGNPTFNRGTILTGEIFQYLPSYMDQLKSEITDNTAWGDTHIYSVALHSSDTYLNETGADNQTVGTNWREMLTTRGGALYDLPYNSQLVPTMVRDITDKELGRPGEPIRCGEVFYLDPYLQEVTFIFFYPEEQKDMKITLQKLDDNSLEPIYQVTQGEETILKPDQMGEMKFDQTHYTSSKTEIKTEYAFSRPRPGAWKFAVEGISDTNRCQAQVEARKIPLLARVLVIQPANGATLPSYKEAPFYDEAQPAFYQLDLRTESRQAISEEANFPLTVRAVLALPQGQTTLPDGSSFQPVDLQMASAGVWTNQQSPLLTPYEGLYSVQFIGTAKHGDQKSDYEVFNTTVNFTARTLEKFGFVVKSPQQNGEYACNIVENKQKINAPLPVQVQVVDSKNQPVDAHNYFTSDLAKTFQVTAYDAAGGEIGQTMLQSSDETGLFEGTLFTESGEPVGCADLRVMISMVGSYDGNEYSLPVTMQEVGITRNLGEGVLVTFEKPDPLAKNPTDTIYEKFGGGCMCGAGPKDTQVEMMLTDLNGGGLDPAAVGSPEKIFEVRLQKADDEAKFEVMTIQRELGPNGYHLVARGGHTLQEPGQYKIVVIPKLDGFAQGYVPGTKGTTEINLTRQDTFWTSKSTCTVASILGLVLLIALIVCIIICVTGGPGGALEFVTPGYETQVQGRIKLSKMRCLSRIRGSIVENLGFKEIRVRKVKPLLSEFDNNGPSRAVDVEITDKDGTLIFTNMLENDIASPFTNDMDIVYR